MYDARVVVAFASCTAGALRIMILVLCPTRPPLEFSVCTEVRRAWRGWAVHPTTCYSLDYLNMDRRLLGRNSSDFSSIPDILLGS